MLLTAAAPLAGVNPPTGAWGLRVLRELCSEMNLNPDFHVQLKHLALDGCIPRDVPWIRQQLSRLYAIEALLRLPPHTLLRHLAYNPRLLTCVDDLVPRFQRLTTLLDAPAETTAGVVTYCQGVLLRDTDDVRRVVATTCSLLSLPPGLVAAAAVVWPYVLLRDARTHAALCRRLRWYLANSDAWAAEVRRMQPKELAVVLQADHAQLDRLEYLVVMKYRPRDPVGLVQALKPSDRTFQRQWPRFRAWCVDNNLVGTRAE
jgi:hypothetical protein